MWPDWGASGGDFFEPEKGAPAYFCSHHVRWAHPVAAWPLQRGGQGGKALAKQMKESSDVD
jgi:hypothetical protein